MIDRVAVRLFGRHVLRRAGDDAGPSQRRVIDRASQTAATHAVASEVRLIEGRVERVSDTIVGEARSADCDLVVMGTHGRRGFGHVLLGSDAERVVRQCPMPVLLVRHPDAAKS